jgi:glycosyltransferase involved in cell wall biosynthesis
MNITLLIAGIPKQRGGIFKIFERANYKYLENLKEYCDKKDLNKIVKFIGFIDEKEIYSLFKISDIVVLPYLSADQSGVMNIALASNTPIIASKVGGLMETLNKSGVLVPPRDSLAISKEIIQLLQNKQKYNQIKKDYIKINKEQSTKKLAEITLKDYTIIK